MRSRLRRRACIVFAAVVAVLCAPASALALRPPTILTAGIDAADRLYVTWSVGAGTTFERAVFATGPQPHPFLAGYFADEHLAEVGCYGPPGCTGTQQTTSFTSPRPIERDRRYFVAVTATRGEQVLRSAVWVIDETKPLIVADEPAHTAGPPRNEPVTGRLFAPVPSASLSLGRLPATIAGVLSSKVRVRVRCTTACDIDMRLMLGSRTLVRRIGGLPAGAPTLLVFRPRGGARRPLRGLGRARLRLVGTVTPLGGGVRRIDRAFVVRR